MFLSLSVLVIDMKISMRRGETQFIQGTRNIFSKQSFNVVVTKYTETVTITAFLIFVQLYFRCKHNRKVIIM